MELGKLFSKICESSLITPIYHLKREEKTKTIVKCSYISEHHRSDLTSIVSTNGQVTHYWTTLHRILLSSNLSLSFSGLIHVSVISLVFLILISRIPCSSKLFVISVVAVHGDSIHVLCGRRSAAGICVFWSDSSLGMVKESPNIRS